MSDVVQAFSQIARRILVVDDEALARQRIVRYVRLFGQQYVLEEAESGIRAVELIRSFRPDVIFLDMEMPGLNGLEVLQQFEQRPFHVIFQTAYDQFAIRAFEEHACDYLLKPFTAERLHQALARALNRATDEQKLRALERQLSAPGNANRTGYLQKLTVKQGNRLRIVPVQEVFCFVSRDHYTCVYFNSSDLSGGNQTLEGICDLSLARLAERLDPWEFKPLHRNNIVRAAAIVALSRSRQSEVLAELANGMKLPVSRSNRRQAKELIKGIEQTAI